MNMKSKYAIIFISALLFTFSNAVVGQANFGGPTVSKTYFKNGLIAREFYMSVDQKIDSIKTYHIEGGLDERFFFSNNLLDGVCEKFTSEGKLKTTWLFNDGVLIRRIDLIKISNLKNKEMTDYNYDNIVKTNLELKSDPTNYGLLYSRSTSRIYLDDNVLAELDFLMFKSQLENIKANLNANNKAQFPTLDKDLAEIYSRLSSIYTRFEIDNLTIDYKLKAIQSDPSEIRHILNLGSYLSSGAQEYRLAIYYLNEVVRNVPNHNFANWALAATYLELEQYQKALDCINLAFENEDNLYVYGYGTSESDLRTIRGLAYHKLGKTDLAKKDLNEALKINEKNSVANKYLGIIYDDLGENLTACTYFQRSRDLGYEKKYYNKSLNSFIKNACGNATAKTLNTTLHPKDLPYIAPNPAEYAIEIFNYPHSNFSFEIFDASGKKVANGKANNKSIQVGRIPSGLYILNIENEGKIESLKLIKK